MTQDQFNALAELGGLRSPQLLAAMQDVLVRGIGPNQAAAAHGIDFQHVYRCRAKLMHVMALAKRARGSLME